MPCDLSHNAFDVTCILALHQLRLITSAAAFIVFGHVTCDACWDTHPLPVDKFRNIAFWQTSFAAVIKYSYHILCVSHTIAP